MKYQANSTALSQSTDCLIIGIYEEQRIGQKASMKSNQITKGYLSQLAQSPRSFRQNWPSDSASFVTESCN
ncbi:MAG: hypothetical protein ACLR5N_03305 [Haemophilus parainfluenzae]